MSTNLAGQSSGEEQYKCSVFVKNIPFFTANSTLKSYFSDFGIVKQVSFIHKNLDYTRSAEVEMESSESVTKILEKKDPHIVDGKPIQVMSFRGTGVHEKEFVSGKYHLNFERLFEPGPFVKSNLENNNRSTQTAYIQLENAFHQFEYTTIRFSHHQKGWFHDGRAVVSFKDGEKKGEILRIANEKFPGCLVNSRYSY